MGTIIANPAEYDGKLVTIKGWASVWHEDYGIWATQDDYRKRNRKNCISLLNSYNDDALNEPVDRKEVLVTGIFYRDAYRDKDGRPVVLLGSCSRLGIQFSEPEGLRRFFN